MEANVPDASRLRSAETRYTRKTVSYTGSKTEIAAELKIMPVLDKIENSKSE